VSGFPLATIAAAKPPPLLDGVNPAWAAALATLHAAAVTPAFGAAKTSLIEADWTALKARLAPFEAWLAAKAGASVERIGLDRVSALLAGNGRDAVAALLAQDKALEPEFKAIDDVVRLVRYHRDLRTLLYNFVNFADPYSRERSASFRRARPTSTAAAPSCASASTAPTRSRR
jgi:hypothetical protein